MRNRSSVLVASTAAAFAAILLGASAVRVSAGSDADSRQQVALLAAGPDGRAGTPAAAAAAPDGSLELLAKRAVAEARKQGANVSFTMLDRHTGEVVVAGEKAPFPTASVAKLFIADDLLFQSSQGKAKFTADDRKKLAVMLRSSDDFPADEFWARGGGNAIIKRVLARYKLPKTAAPYDGNWWNTMSTTKDLVRYYDMLLAGGGGLPAQQVDVILGNLAASTPIATDGYPQRFGIPDGLFAESVAVKQGWMCCWGPMNQVHLTTGVIGPDHRYIIAVASMQPASEAKARDTVTRTLKTIFPGGKI